MKKCRQYGGLFMLMTGMIYLLSSTGCVSKPAIVILESSRAVKVSQGQAASFDGWLLSDKAMTDLLTCCEMVDKK